MADYGKQKSGRAAANRPPHREHNEPGGPANPFGARPDKAALLERMRQAAARAKDEAPDGAPEAEGRAHSRRSMNTERGPSS